MTSGKQVETQPQDKNPASEHRPESETKGATKPTQIDGEIKNNGVEPGSDQAKHKSPEVKNSSAEDKSLASEAKPVVVESSVQNTEGPATPEPRNSTDGEKQPSGAKQEVTPPEPAKEKIEPAKIEPAKVESAKIETAKIEPAKIEPAKIETAKIETAPRVELAKVESSRISEQEKPVDTAHTRAARTVSRRIPPGGHSSQLW